MRHLFLRAPALLLAVALIALSAVNTAPVAIRFPGLAAAVELPVYLVFLAGLLLGVGLAALASLPQRWRSWRRARRAERRMSDILQRGQGPEAPGQTANNAPDRALAAIDRAQRPSRT